MPYSLRDRLRLPSLLHAPRLVPPRLVECDPGCNKAARDMFFCAGHGGGRRCEVASCSKGAVGSSTFCTAHGGGRRCLSPGCPKSAQSGTDHCVRHGGGRKCTEPGCTRLSRSKTDLCAMHAALHGQEMSGIKRSHPA